MKNDPTIITRVNRLESLEEESAWHSAKGDENSGRLWSRNQSETDFAWKIWGESSGEVQLWSRLWVMFRFRESRLWCTNTVYSVLEAKCCSSVGNDELFSNSEVVRKGNWAQTKSSPGWEGYKNIPEVYIFTPGIMHSKFGKTWVV